MEAISFLCDRFQTILWAGGSEGALRFENWQTLRILGSIDFDVVL